MEPNSKKSGDKMVTANDKKGDERRKNQRIDVKIWAEEKSTQGEYFHFLSNLSVGGFFIEKKLPFTEGAIVNLELILPDHPEKIKVKGLVVANYKDPRSNYLGAGVKFIDLDPVAANRIENFLNNLKKM